MIGDGKRDKFTVLVDGAPIPDQFAIYANHQPRRKANAILTWDKDRYYGRTPVGQPVLMLTKSVAVGEEITADYGPYYGYKNHGFRRDSVGNVGKSTSVPAKEAILAAVDDGPRLRVAADRIERRERIRHDTDLTRHIRSDQ